MDGRIIVEPDTLPGYRLDLGLEAGTLRGSFTYLPDRSSSLDCEFTRVGG